jgi:signal transduction histidine kinase
MDRFDISLVRPAFRQRRLATVARAVAASPAGAASASVVLVLLIALADLATGYEFTLSILYLIPIFLVTWFVGFPAAVALSVVSTLAWFATDMLAGHEYSHPFYRYWEALIKLVLFVVFAAILARLKLALARSDEKLQQHREQLEATARLVAVGEMASMLAHQINQPLSAVINYNKSCLRRLRSGTWDAATLAGIMEQSSSEAARAGGIIQRVREFVRKREPSRAPTEIDPLIEGTLPLMRGEAAKRGIALVFASTPGLPRVDADRVMVEQVIINLLKNAMEAMDDGSGELRVTTAADQPGYVRVSVVDRGRGLPRDVAANLFQPFFTTKREGMGLGLSISRSIVEFHRGALWATPNPEGGTTFHFTLPVEEAAA